MPEASLPATYAVDLEHPNVVRVHDHLLGGTANWAIDREFSRALLHHLPELPQIAMASRMFVARVVRYLARRGVRQFLDVGSGVLSTHNTHKIADYINPGSRVVYVIKEPVAVAHAKVLLDEEGDPARHAIITADLRCAEDVLTEAFDTGVLTRDEPFAVLMFAVLHMLPPGSSDRIARCVARYREILPRGSYLGISHIADDGVPDELRQRFAAAQRVSHEWGSSPLYSRSRSSIAALLGNFPLLEPGMTWSPCWHPSEECPQVQPVRFAEPSRSLVWGGVGRKP